MCLWPAAGHTQGFEALFEEAAPGAVLEQGAVPGWKQQVGAEDSAPPGAAVVSEEAGYTSGQGLRLAERGTFVVYETGRDLWSADKGAAVFRLDFRFGDEMPVEFSLHNGSSSAGLLVVVNRRNDTVTLSQGGGENAFRGKRREHSVNGLKDQTWYTLEIRGLTLNEAGEEPSPAAVYLYEADEPSHILLEGVEIMPSGSAPFSVLKTFRARRWGNPGAYFDIDNVRLQAASQP